MRTKEVISSELAIARKSATATGIWPQVGKQGRGKPFCAGGRGAGGCGCASARVVRHEEARGGLQETSEFLDQVQRPLDGWQGWGLPFVRDPSRDCGLSSFCQIWSGQCPLRFISLPHMQ